LNVVKSSGGVSRSIHAASIVYQVGRPDSVLLQWAPKVEGRRRGVSLEAIPVIEADGMLARKRSIGIREQSWVVQINILSIETWGLTLKPAVVIGVIAEIDEIWVPGITTITTIRRSAGSEASAWFQKKKLAQPQRHQIPRWDQAAC
jgi:hypothetical protein